MSGPRDSEGAVRTLPPTSQAHTSMRRQMPTRWHCRDRCPPRSKPVAAMSEIVCRISLRPNQALHRGCQLDQRRGSCLAGAVSEGRDTRACTDARNHMTEADRHDRASGSAGDETFKRHGPEPPENDSGPSPSIDEARREEKGTRV